MLGFWPPLPADLAPSSLSCCSGPSSCSGLLFHPTHRQVRGTGGNPTVGPRRESWGHLAITNLPLLQLCALRRRAQPLCLSEGAGLLGCSWRPFPGLGTERPLHCRCSQGTAWELDSPATPPICQQALALARTHPAREEHPALLTLFPRTSPLPGAQGGRRDPGFPPLPGGRVHLLLMAEPWAFPAASAPCPSWRGSRDGAQLAAGLG